VLAVYLASCTHMPMGQRAFDTFEQCVAANLGIAVAGGGAIGALGSALARQISGDRGTIQKVAATAGVAAAVMIGLTAWKKCAAVYNTSERVAQGPVAPASPPAAQRRRPGLDLERLDVRVEGNENDPPIPEFAFSYVPENPEAKDIKARFRHKVEIVRFKADDHDRLILTDANGEALKDSGRNIALEEAMRMPRERLFWVTIADEGKDDYVEDVVIQPAQSETYRHRLQVPARAQLPLPLPVPMRYTLTIEVEALKSTRIVDFALLGTAERPQRFTANTASGAGRPPPAPATRSVGSPPPPARNQVAQSAPARAPAPAAPTTQAEFIPTHKLKRGVPLYNDASANRRPIGRINKDTEVRIEDRATVTVNKRAVEWVRVNANGAGGWVPMSELEAK
jgi:hypothetical protein